jgi:hypothetical protein
MPQSVWQESHLHGVCPHGVWGRATKFGATTNPVRGCENSVFRFQKLEISSPLFSSPLIGAIRFIRGSQSSHFLKGM